jgi:hypothetical protein
MGYGVADGEVFDSLLEEKLNSLQSPGQRRIELLNFGAGRSFAIHRRLLLEQKVFEFQPDAVFYIAHQDEFMGPAPHLAEIWYKKFDLADPCLEAVVTRAGIKPDTSCGLAHALLNAHSESIVLCSYERIVEECRRRGIVPVWVYLPMPGVANSPSHSATIIKLAERADFLVVDLSDWAEGYSPGQVKLSPEDHHANAQGHQRIAERLLRAIRGRAELLPGFDPRDATMP